MLNFTLKIIILKKVKNIKILEVNIFVEFKSNKNHYIRKQFRVKLKLISSKISTHQTRQNYTVLKF